MRDYRCGTMTVRSQPNEHGRVTYLAAGCKAWRCKYCGPKKAEKLKKAIAQAAEEKGLTCFLTLTLDTKFLSEADLRDGGIAYIRKSWSKLRIYLKREHGRAIDFISIVELQKRGVAHLHILVDRYLPYEWVRNSWVAVGGGRIVVIKFVDVHRVSGYLSKYLAKDAVGGLPVGVRRYSVSRGITLRPKAKSGWSLEWRSLNTIRNLSLNSLHQIREVAWSDFGRLEALVLSGTG